MALTLAIHVRAGVGLKLRICALLVLAVSVGLVGARPASPQGQYIRLGPDQVVYAEVEPSRAGKLTLWPLNALTYTTRHWDLVVEKMRKIDPELGFVRVDLEGQGRTYRRNPLRRTITLDDQVQLISALKQKLDLPGEHAVLGLSYGGALAIELAIQHPDAFSAFIAISPHVEAGGLGLPEWFVLDQQLESWISRAWMYQVFPRAEPSALEEFPNKLESLVMMSMGIRGWTASERASLLPAGRLHVSASAFDLFVPLHQIEKFVANIPPGRLASYTHWDFSGHKLTEEQPELVAAYAHAILNRNPKFSEGRRWRVNPHLATPAQLVDPRAYWPTCTETLR